jgi:hypothetical protein
VAKLYIKNFHIEHKEVLECAVTLSNAVLLPQMLLHVVGGLEGLAALRAGGRLLHGVLHPKRTAVAVSPLSIIVADPDRRCGSGSLSRIRSGSAAIILNPY